MLHDEAGQYLALAHMALAELARALGDEHSERVLEVRRYLDEVERQLRDASCDAGPRAMSASGLVDALRFLAAACERRSGIRVTVDAALHLTCPLWIESFIYTFVREALSNVAEHAAATQAHVFLSRSTDASHASDTTFCCAVRHDGLGFPTSDATVTVTCVERQGSEIRAKVPVRP